MHNEPGWIMYAFPQQAPDPRPSYIKPRATLKLICCLLVILLISCPIAWIGLTPYIRDVPKSRFITEAPHPLISMTAPGY